MVGGSGVLKRDCTGPRCHRGSSECQADVTRSCQPSWGQRERLLRNITVLRGGITRTNLQFPLRDRCQQFGSGGNANNGRRVTGRQGSYFWLPPITVPAA